MKPTTLEGLEAYANEGRPPGSFLRAVLENNLMEAFGRADEENRADMFEICGYVYNEMPASSHGSPDKVRLWLEYKDRERQAFIEKGLHYPPATLIRPRSRA